MNKKALATAMVVLGLFPSLLFAQLYRMEVDAQESGSQKVIDRVFTGNTVGLQVSFYDGGDPLPVTNWTMRFMYGYGQYDTNGMVPVVGTAGASNNVVVFDSATNVFFSENGSYYFSIVGTNTAGKIKTFARGRMIEEYDPASGGSYSNGIPMPWANLNFASKEWIVEYISTNEFETVVSYGTASNTAYRGDNGAAVSNIAASAYEGVSSNASIIATLTTGKLDAATASLTYLTDAPETGGPYARQSNGWVAVTGTPVYVESDPIFSATNAWLVRTNDSAYTATVAKAASAVQPGDTNGWVVSSHSGLATEAQAGQIATNVASGYLPLAGHNGLVVLGTRTRGYAASTNLGDYGFAAGFDTSAGNAGFAAGDSTSAGDYGFAAGFNTSAGDFGFAAGASTSAGEYGFAAGDSTSAGNYGFAAGEATSAGTAGFAAGADTSAGEYGFAAGVGTSAGDYGFAAGAAAKGADGSFVFADNSAGGMPFSRTNIPNSFSLRVAGGIYAKIGTNVFAVSNAVTMNGVELGAGGGSGISADTATNIAQNVATSYGFAPTSSVQAIAGQIATNVSDAALAASNLAEGTPQALALADGFVTIWSTGLWEQAYTATGAATVRVVKANVSNSAAIIWHATLSNRPTFFVTNNLLGFTTTGISTNGGTTTISLRSKPGSTNWTWSVDLP